MVLIDNLGNRPGELDVFQDLIADLGVAFDQGLFLFGQSGRL